MLLLVPLWACMGHAGAQPADMVMVNAKLATLDAASSFAEALAVRDGRLILVGSNAAALGLAGPATRRIDAGGRLVIPGLIDSHMHAVRAALSYATEVNWIDVRTIPEALERLRLKARERPGGWLIVAGGWTEQQFAEKRKPTLQEISTAVPGHPVWIQQFYSSILMTAEAIRTFGVTQENLAPRIKPERDAAGTDTGWWSSDIVATSALFDRLPKPGHEDSVAGTRQFFHELNRLGITGVVDPGGFSLDAAQYAPLMQVWRDRQLTVRVAYSLFAQRAGSELQDFQALTQLLPMSYGDDMLRFNGIGERVTIAMYNNYAPDEVTQTRFVEAIRWAAKNKLAVTVHWTDGKSVHRLLDIYERLDREVSIRELRWSIAHLDDVETDALARMKALGIGWTMQDWMYFAGDRIKSARPEAVSRIPPIGTALRIGVRIGAGTDAHRVASYNPFIALQWMLDGKTVAGNTTRSADEIPSRNDALRLYTTGSAWFSFDEGKRGSLEAGKLADFVILDRDFFTVPIEQIGQTSSLVTVIGGVVVYSTRPF